MPAPSSIKMLLDLAQNRVDAAARQLGQLNSEERKAEHKLRVLLEFRHDYQARLSEHAQRGIEQVAWRNFLAFMGKLDHAISEQSKALVRSRDNQRAGRDEWQAEQRMFKSYDTLSQRHAREEAERAARREQREHDEQAIKSFVHRRLAAGRH
jgi:flagellar FliJ protein